MSKRGKVTLVAVVAAAAVAVLLVRGDACDSGDEHGTGAPATPPARDAVRATEVDRGGARKRPRLAESGVPRWVLEASGDAGPRGANDAGHAAPAPRFRLARLFRGDCQFGVNAHCREWGERAARCDEGDATACVELGDLLIGESPMQPLWGSLLLLRACELGRDEVCERATAWNEWSRYGYSPSVDPEPPEDLAERCEEGNLVACGLIAMKRARGGGAMDEELALAACRAGFRDVCAMLIEVADSPEDVIAALTAGCDLPDAWMCFHLAGYYSTYCADADPPPNCPPPDPARAAHFRALACQLEPELAPCRAP